MDAASAPLTGLGPLSQQAKAFVASIEAALGQGEDGPWGRAIHLPEGDIHFSGYEGVFENVCRAVLRVPGLDAALSHAPQQSLRAALLMNLLLPVPGLNFALLPQTEELVMVWSFHAVPESPLSPGEVKDILLQLMAQAAAPAGGWAR